MNSVAVFESVHPAIAVVWVVGMSVSIAFCIRARAMHRRNLQERLAERARHGDADSRHSAGGDRASDVEPSTHPS